MVLIRIETMGNCLVCNGQVLPVVCHKAKPVSQGGMLP
jgi:hypothetical protein